MSKILESSGAQVGAITQYQKSTIRRGAVTITMSGTTGTTTVKLNDLVDPTSFVGIYKAEVAEWSSGGGITAALQAPYIVNSGGTITTNISFYLNTYVTPGIGNELDLVINYYKSTATNGDLKYMFYTIYTETSVPVTGVDSDWNYRT